MRHFRNDAKRRLRGSGCPRPSTVLPQDPLIRIFDDEEHSIDKRREAAVGYSERGRLLVVFFTEREAAIQIFSAREVTRRERHDYEKNVVS